MQKAWNIKKYINKICFFIQRIIFVMLKTFERHFVGKNLLFLCLKTLRFFANDSTKLDQHVSFYKHIKKIKKVTLTSEMKYPMQDAAGGKNSKIYITILHLLLLI